MNETETRDRKRLRWALAAALALHVGVMFARLPEGWRPRFVAPAEGGPAINFEMVELVEATAMSAPSEAAEPPAATPEPPTPLVAEQRPVEEAPMPTPEPMIEERMEDPIEQAPPPPVARPTPKMVTPRVRPVVTPNPVAAPKPAAKVASHPSIASAASPGGAASVPGTPGARVADRGPQALSCPLPPYPAGARAADFQGVARLRVTVGTDGRPQNVSVAQSSGRADCDTAACDTVRRTWRFAAAVRGGRPTEGALMVAVRFSLGG